MKRIATALALACFASALPRSTLTSSLQIRIDLKGIQSTSGGALRIAKLASLDPFLTAMG